MREKKGESQKQPARWESQKQLVKWISTGGLLALETGVYWSVWNGYYNKIIEFPFWRRGNWLMVALYGALLVFFLTTYGGFRIGVLKSWNLVCSQLLSLAFVNGITYVQISLLDKRFHSPGAMALMGAGQLLLSVGWTFLFQRIYRSLFPPRRLLLVHGDRPMFHLTEKIHSREDKYYLAGAVHIREGVQAVMEQAAGYDAVIVGDLPAQERNELLKQCFDSSVRTYTVPKISDILIRTSGELDIFDSPLLLSRNQGLTRGQEAVKRMFDLALSGVGLAAASPFFLLIAIALKLTDRGAVFYTQKRLTKDGKIFRIYKFRTMVEQAEQAGEARLASEQDDRILPVGRFLRRTRLDELPQLYNIWRGDMSFVGPRPERPELAARIEAELPEFRYRLKMKAGLTGWAQVYGKYNTTAYDKLKLDLNYIRNYSLLLDLRLILMTPKIMLLKESAEGVKTGEEGTRWKNF